MVLLTFISFMLTISLQKNIKHEYFKETYIVHTLQTSAQESAAMGYIRINGKIVVMTTTTTIMIVFQGCHHKAPQTRWLVQRNLLSQSSRGQKSKIKISTGLIPVEGCVNFQSLHLASGCFLAILVFFGLQEHCPNSCLHNHMVFYQHLWMSPNFSLL